jgi:sporulation protein YlmC with PRC-barrel domain
MKAGVFIIAAALTGAPVGGALAQETGQPGQQQVQPRDDRQPGDRSAAARPDQQRTGMVASDAITGIDVRDHQGENIGDIDRLIINRETGDIAHVIVATGGFLGIGRDHIQLSWDQVELVRDDGEIVARVNRAAVDAAPEVDRDRFDAAWERDRIGTRVGTTGTARDADRDRDTVGRAGRDRETTGAPRPGARDTAQPRDTAQQPGVADASFIAEDRLTGTQVQDAQRNDIGRVERLMIDPQDGRVGYMVVGTGGFLGVGRDHMLVPFEHAQVSMIDRNLVVTLDQRVIDEAPRVWTDDRDRVLDRDRGVTDRDRGTTDRR